MSLCVLTLSCSTSVLNADAWLPIASEQSLYAYEREVWQLACSPFLSVNDRIAERRKERREFRPQLSRMPSLSGAPYLPVLRQTHRIFMSPL